ncbi:hypothetical protein GOODEAATRI_026269 [Goodea atripinnis]|uniref:Uncharacterized protein n=1 Tax=Goodea atripinnis TaxID=208336 RepID=A0ABV0PS34_9TELE
MVALEEQHRFIPQAEKYVERPTISHTCTFKRRVARRKLLLKEYHRKSCLKFVSSHIRSTAEQKEGILVRLDKLSTCQSNAPTTQKRPMICAPPLKVSLPSPLTHPHPPFFLASNSKNKHINTHNFMFIY